MQIDVGIYIADLLYEHDSVVIPGLGAFVASYQPAEIDQVQRKIQAPGKAIHFNSNLVVNDGLLVNYIRERNALSLTEAQQAVDHFVRQVRETLDRREVFVFPKVGRLYSDFEQKLQFLPDETNFNVDAFGLPTVEFFPVMPKSTAGASKPAAPAAAKGMALAAGKDWSELIAGWFQRWLPLIGIVTVIIVIGGVLLTLQNEEPPASAAQPQEIPSGRINVKPSLDESPDGSADAEISPPAAGDQQVDSEGPLPVPEDTEGITARPGQKYAIILIGLFGKQRNINRLTEKIYKAGFEPYTEPAGSLTRVGVIVPYDNEAGVDRALEDVRNRFDSQAFVYRRGVEK